MHKKADLDRILLTCLALTGATAAHAQDGTDGLLSDADLMLTVFSILLLVAAGCITFYTIVIFGRKEHRMSKREMEHNAQLAALMHSCDVKVWLMLASEDRYQLLSDRGTVEQTFAPLDFAHLYEHHGFDVMHQTVHDIADGKLHEGSCRVMSRRDGMGGRRTYDVRISVFETDKTGRPKTIIGMQYDITAELEKQKNMNNLLMRYHTIFDSSIIDMMYFDKNGVLQDINNKACETFGIKDRKALLEHKIRLKDTPAYQNLDVKKFDGYRMTSITDIDKVRSRVEGRIPDITIKGKIYYETMVNPIYDDKGELTGIYTAGRTINEMVESYHRQKESTRMLQEATRHLKDYIDNINLSLQVSQVRLTNYMPDSHELEISNDLNRQRLRLTQLRFYALVAPEFRRQVRNAINKMDRRVNARFDLTLRTLLHDEKRRNMWVTFSLVPIRDANGRVTHYFGMSRNETEMVETEAMLKTETKKAQETELLKNSFLQNMSYEIRTPLNAVLGFATLFNTDHDPEDEPVFVELIKSNSNHLLKLVNDILFISKLDARMVEIRTEPTDFAMMFEGCCNMGWSNRAEGVSTVTENPYSHLVVDIDYSNLQQVIQRICEHAALTTEKGVIRSKYEYRHSMLTIIVEDTGRGYDAEESQRVFDRFSTSSDADSGSTGLGMPIAKELTEQMGGFTEFQSEPGKGSTVWVTLPCTATQIELRVES